MSTEDFESDTIDLVSEHEHSVIDEEADLTNPYNIIKHMVSMVYQIQSIRIATGNRIYSVFRLKMLKSNPQDSKLEVEDTKLLKIIKEAYYRLIDSTASASQYLDKRATLNKFKGNDIITSFVEYSLIDHYIKLLDIEKRASDDLEEIVTKDPMWVFFFKDLKGIGPRMAAICIRYFRIDNKVGRHPSNFVAYAGIDVLTHYENDKGETIECNEGRSNKKHHLVERSYIDSSNETNVRKSITYEPFLKKCILGVLVPCFIKCKNPEYYPSYLDYKARLNNRPEQSVEETKRSKIHIERMARRRIARLFLEDLHKAMCDANNLCRSSTYREGILNLQHGQPRTEMNKVVGDAYLEQAAKLVQARHQVFLDGKSWWKNK